ncbi:MAG: hypothetical protein KatS3mg031_2473 [Chitinophagales bacterium]|nr:MAG: hypothetical protein KatS3mg031_2473 [Chitinophagales bacterium]
MALLFSVSVLTSASAQGLTPKEICKLDPHLQETSGLVITGSKIWTHNDSGNPPVLYGMNESCRVTNILYLNAKNTDWEEITKDEEGSIYIGDFGNGGNNRRDLRIYKIPDPATISGTIVQPEIIQFSYADQRRFPPLPSNQNYDMEAMIYYKGNLYLFSKNRTEPFNGYTKLYRLPARPGTHVAELLDSIYLGPPPMMQSWVTAAALSPDKTKLALLSSDRIWLFTCFTDDRFFSGKMKTIELTSFTQKEAVCFKNNYELLITDELSNKVFGGRLYSLDLRQVVFDPCP